MILGLDEDSLHNSPAGSQLDLLDGSVHPSHSRRFARHLRKHVAHKCVRSLLDGVCFFPRPNC
jgi:hypothetical protein